MLEIPKERKDWFRGLKSGSDVIGGREMKRIKYYAVVRCKNGHEVRVEPEQMAERVFEKAVGFVLVCSVCGDERVLIDQEGNVLVGELREESKRVLWDMLPYWVRNKVSNKTAEREGQLEEIEELAE